MSQRLRVVPRERTLAFYLDNLEGGGVQKNTLILAGALAARGHAVELLVCRPRGALHDQLSPEIEVVALDPPSSVWSARMLALRSDPANFGAVLGGIALAPRPSSTLGYLGSLAAVLETRRPYALYAANTHMKPRGAAARGALLGVDTRIVVTERNAFHDGHLQRGWSAQFLPGLVRRMYGQAEAVVAVSDGVADELAAWSGLPRARIVTIYNPVVTDELIAEARRAGRSSLVPAGHAAGDHERGPARARQGPPDADPGVRPRARARACAPGDLRPGQERGEDRQEQSPRCRRWPASSASPTMWRSQGSSPIPSPTWRAPPYSRCPRSTRGCPAC